MEELEEVFRNYSNVAADNLKPLTWKETAIVGTVMSVVYASIFYVILNKIIF